MIIRNLKVEYVYIENMPALETQLTALEFLRDVKSKAIVFKCKCKNLKNYLEH